MKINLSGQVATAGCIHPLETAFMDRIPHPKLLIQVVPPGRPHAFRKCRSLFLISGLLYAQFETVEILGAVRDTMGSALPNASVTLINLDTGIQARATTDNNGNYHFFNVKVGHYTVTVEHTGFSKITTSNVSVNVNARQRVDVILQVGGITESVEVSEAASALETDTSECGQVITSNFSEEYGRGGGAVVNAVVRLGTKQFSQHGFRIPVQKGPERRRLSFRRSPGNMPEAYVAAEPVRSLKVDVLICGA
jgi:hypothetical protein